MTLFADERGAELRQLFFESAQELLQNLNDEALKLEQQPAELGVAALVAGTELPHPASAIRASGTTNQRMAASSTRSREVTIVRTGLG